MLQRGPQHNALARAILKEPATDWWFGPLDRDRQVWVTQNGSPPDPTGLVTPSQPPSRHERYAQRMTGAFCTSTLIGETASLIAAIDGGVGDLSQVYSPPPYAFWLLTVDASARVLEIDGSQAWHDLCASYPAEGATGRGVPDFSADKGRLVPDWSAVAVDWDAVHLTFGGLLTGEQVRVESLSGWTYLWDGEAEQTMWLRWMFKSSQQMPDYHESVGSALWSSLHYLLPPDQNVGSHTVLLRRTRGGSESPL